VSEDRLPVAWGGKNVDSVLNGDLAANDNTSPDFVRGNVPGSGSHAVGLGIPESGPAMRRSYLN
ncbi:unnamed protein product, partial [Allacma fusca]